MGTVMAERLDVTFKLAEPKSTPNSRRLEDETMRILILGDFSGSALSGGQRQQGITGRQDVLQVDIDNFDQVISKIAPRLHIQLDHDSASAVDLTFRQMEDFHPDALFRKLELFQGLADIRKRLGNSGTFKEAAEQLRAPLAIKHEPLAEEEIKAKPENDVSTLERLLGDRPMSFEHSAKQQAKNAASSYIESIVAQYIVPDAPPFQDAYLKAVDDALGAKMSKLLHHPDFQALEASWRELEMLVNNLETGEALSLHLLDITKKQLLAELSEAGENLAGSGLFRQLMDASVSTFGGEPWSLLIGNYRFGGSAEDVTLLAACGVLASHAGGPFIAEADPGLLGCRLLADSPDPHDWEELPPETKKRWHALRQSPAAAWIGLALPRILLRLPYGRDTDPVEHFDFEEMPTSQEQHQAFLWGNPAFHCALLIGRSFSERGWSMQLGDNLQIDDLPAYILKQHGESVLQPCAEVCLSDSAMEKILDQGIMPFISHRSSSTVRLARFQSVAEPPRALAGPWDA
jgi:type VI secretion system protein ImpC